MTKEDLIKDLSAAINKRQVLELAALVAKESGAVKNVLDLCFHAEQSLAFRAAWVLEQVVFLYWDNFQPFLLHFLEHYPEQNNLSGRRHYTKIMERITAKRKSFPELSDYNWDMIIESTFKWLTEPPCPVAVQVNCLDILFNLRDYDNWIGEEVEAQTVFLLKDGSAAMQARGKEILKKLKRKR